MRHPRRAAGLLVGGIAALIASCRGPAPHIVDISPARGLICTVDHRQGAPVRFGAFLGDGMTGMTDSIAAFRARAGVSPGIVRIYTSLGRSIDASSDLARTLTAVARSGAAPMLVIEPTPTGPSVPAGLLERIARGDSDSLLLARARELTALELSSLMIELAPEMNARFGAAWQADANQPEPTRSFREAWRRMVGVMRAGGLTNARWIWAPSAGNAHTHAATGAAHWNFAGHYYPGDDVVDIIGLHAFNDPIPQRAWVPFAELLDGAAADHSLSALVTNHPTKPLMLTEIASDEHPRDPGAKGGWVTEMFAQLARCPSVVAVVWFDIRKERAWGIGSSPASLQAFRQALK